MRVSWWSIGYWLALVAAAVLVIVIAFNRSELERRLGQQKQALAEAIARTHEVEGKRAEAQSSILYAREASRQVNRTLGDVASALPGLCAGVSDGHNQCSLLLPNIEFYRYWSLAATLRSESRSRDDFNEVAQAFQEIEAAINRRRGGRENDRWLALAREGVAYARYRQRRLEEAARIIQQAYQLRAGPVFVGLTRLKIMCAQQAQPSLIQRELAELRNNFRSEAVRLRGLLERYNYEAMQRLARDASEAAALIERDEELFARCGDANIRPIGAPAT